MKQHILRIGLFSIVFFVAFCCFGQNIDLAPAKETIANTGKMIAQLVGGIIGLVAIGRSAYKFAHGEHDSTTSLITGIVAVVLGQIASKMM